LNSPKKKNAMLSSVPYIAVTLSTILLAIVSDRLLMKPNMCLSKTNIRRVFTLLGNRYSYSYIDSNTFGTKSFKTLRTRRARFFAHFSSLHRLFVALLGDHFIGRFHGIQVGSSFMLLKCVRMTLRSLTK
jgi:hypothetical protein